MRDEALDGGSAVLPTINQDLYDRMIEIQGIRNKALAKARG
jgi:hypothetical protein